MNKRMVARAQTLADYIINTKSTIRETAKVYHIKSTVHKDVKERLLEINPEKYCQVEEIFKKHLETRHIKGGESTKRKYSKLKEKV